MTHTLPDQGLVFRRPEPRDLPSLLKFKNDPEVTELLASFHTGMSAADGETWLASQQQRPSTELVYVIATTEDACIGQVGLHDIDHRVRCAELDIMIGVKSLWGRGYGKAATRWMVDYGFSSLNLNRIYLRVLDSNARAIHVYGTLGFEKEGTLREAQFKDGRYHDIIHMGLLRSEWQTD